MGDAARQAPDGFHLLRLVQLRLQLRLVLLGPLALGDVDPAPHQVGHPVQFHPPSGHVIVAQFPAPAHKAANFGLRASAGEGLLDRILNKWAVLGKEPIERIGLQNLVGSQIRQALQIPVPSQVSPLAVQYEEDAGDGVDHVRGELALPAQGAIGFLSLGDVVQDRDRPRNGSIASAQHCHR